MARGAFSGIRVTLQLICLEGAPGGTCHGFFRICIMESPRRARIGAPQWGHLVPILGMMPSVGESESAGVYTPCPFPWGLRVAPRMFTSISICFWISLLTPGACENVRCCLGTAGRKSTAVPDTGPSRWRRRCWRPPQVPG